MVSSCTTRGPDGCRSAGSLDRTAVWNVASEVIGFARNPSAPAASADQQPEQSRFGRLITRMTGHASDAPGEDMAQPAMQPTARPQPPVYNPDAGSAAQKLEENEQERIEIPAFLRRQAN